MSEPFYSLRRGTLNRLASELHSGGRISAERVTEILNESKSGARLPISADNEDAVYRAYLAAIGEPDETVTDENHEIEIDPVTAEVLEAQDRAREARERREEAEAAAMWPEFAAWAGMKP